MKTLDEMVKAMMEELDCEVTAYEKYTDEGVRKDISNEYTIKARAYKMLIRNLFGLEALFDNAFPRSIHDYIDYRKVKK